jgi:HAD superfamily hydrolase (TIGR01490 family)
MAYVFFDFDGTLTITDSFVPYCFLSLIHQPKRIFKIFPLLSVCKDFLHRKVDSHFLKEKFLLTFFHGVSVKYIDKINNLFIYFILPCIVRRKIFALMQEHQRKGDKVFLVSASPDIYLTAIKNTWKLDGLICTKTEWINGYLTGRILGKNCRGEEKVKRILSLFNKSELLGSFAYGNSKADEPMLNLSNFGKIV